MAFKDLLKKFVPGEEIAEGVPEVSKLEEKKKKRTTPQDDAKRTRNSQVKIRLTEEVAELKAAASALGAVEGVLSFVDDAVDFVHSADIVGKLLADFTAVS